jgi:hypothetical protein
MSESVDFAEERGIQLVLLPAHSSHVLQPLDLCFFGWVTI